MAEIRHQIAIDAPPEKVYAAALATQAGLVFMVDRKDTITDHKTGGKAEFGFDKHSMVFRMTIERLDPNRQVIWDCHGDNPEWIGTTLTWTIAPADGGSLLRFTQSGWKDMTDMVAICNSTWGALMWRIKDHVEGKIRGRIGGNSDLSPRPSFTNIFSFREAPMPIHTIAQLPRQTVRHRQGQARDRGVVPMSAPRARQRQTLSSVAEGRSRARFVHFFIFEDEAAHAAPLMPARRR